MFLPFAIEPVAMASAGDPRRLMSGEDLAEALQTPLLAPGSPWRWRDDLLMHAPPLPGVAEERAGAYEEFVYFYPYVQRFLYGAPRNDRGPAPAAPVVRAPDRASAPGAGDGHSRPLCVYQRADIVRARVPAVAIDKNTVRNFDMRVDRVNLNVFDTGHAILAVELSIGCHRSDLGRPHERLSLREAIAIVHNMRQLFPPYRHRLPGTEMGTLPPCFPRLRWIGADGRETGRGDEEDHAGHVAATLTPPLDVAWREILAPLPVEGYPLEADTDVVLSQCGDDRAPLMVMLGVDDPGAIAPSDWYRLAIGDEPGDRGVFPIADSAANGFEGRFCYDDFWQPSRPTYRTRHVCTGSIYAMVGEDGDYFRDILQVHFRRHYHQLALISHYHRAALVSLSERMTDAVQPGARGRGGVERFRKAAHAIQRDVLRFTNRYWFVEITPQQQGRDLFAMWRRHLGTADLYEQLSRELQSTTAFLDAEEDARIANSAHEIALFGVPGLVIAAFTGALGMNVFKSDNGLSLGILSIVVTVLAVLVLLYVGYRLVKGLLERSNDRGEAGNAAPRRGGPAATVAAATLLLFAAILTAMSGR